MPTWDPVTKVYLLPLTLGGVDYEKGPSLLCPNHEGKEEDSNFKQSKNHK